MRLRLLFAAATVLGLAASNAPAVADAARPPAPGARDAARGPGPRGGFLGRFPVRFETNCGQAPEGWDVLARARGYHAFLRSDEAVFSFDGRALAVALDGASRVGPDPSALRTGATTNYFVGNDPERWIREIPMTSGVDYPGVRPGSVLRWRGPRGLLEFDLDVPGTDEPVLVLAGWHALRVTDAGALLVEVPHGVATLSAPVAWQTDGAGARRGVPAEYELDGDGRVRIALGTRDAGRTTHIDPSVSYESYLGTSSADASGGAAIDGSGNVLLTGITASASFPVTAGAYDTTLNALDDGFVVKLGSDGNSIAWATYFGSTQNESPGPAVADASGNLVVNGYTGGSDFPTTAGVVAPTSPTPSGMRGYLLKLGASGSSLVWSTYQPAGTGFREIALGPTGKVYGVTRPGAARLAADASAVDWSVTIAPVLNQSNTDLRCIAVNSSDECFLAGYTAQTNFPFTSGAYDRTLSGTHDAVLVKLASNGSVAWATALGGTGSESIEGVGLDLLGRPTVVGSTSSSDFPVTADAWRATGSGDPFLARFSADGTTLRYATYVPTNIDESVISCRVHPTGVTYFAGQTRSTDLATSDAFQTSHGGGAYDAFVIRMGADGARSWASYAGGSGSEGMGVGGLAMGADGTIVVLGATASTNLPVTSGAYQTSASGGGGDCFFLSVDDDLPTALEVPAVTTTALPEWTVGVAVTTVAGTLQRTGGDGPFTWTLASGSLPEGLSLSSAGVVGGTPTTAGDSSFRVRVRDTWGFEAEGDVTMRVNPAPGIVTDSLPPWTRTVPFDRGLEVAGGTAPFSWSVTEGDLPAGLSLDAAGNLAGTPSATGSSTFTVQVVDARGAAATHGFTMVVNPVPAVTPRSVDPWTAGRPLTEQFAATGGTGPLVWSVSAGTLPVTGTIGASDGRCSGTTRGAGTYRFTLRVTDTLGAFGETSFEALVNPPPSISTRNLPVAAKGRPYVSRLEGTGGTPPLAWDDEAPGLPAGLVLDAVTGAISGAPTDASLVTRNVTYADRAGAVARAAVVLDVADGPDLTRRKASLALPIAPAGGVRTLQFVELTPGAALTVRVSGGATREAPPSIRLLDASGAEIDVSALLRPSKKGNQLRGFVAGTAVRCFVEIESAPGATGKLRVAIQVAPPAKWSGTVTIDSPGGTAEIRVGAPPGARLASAVARAAKRSAALPEIVSFVDSAGAELAGPGTVKTKGKVSTLRTTAVPAGPAHVLRIGGRDGTTGAVEWSVTWKLAKTYDFALPDLAAGDGEESE